MNTPAWYQSALDAAAEIARRQVFFVMGCQKSGTTWLQHLLDGHPAVACRGEGHFGNVLMPLVPDLVNSYVDTPKVGAELVAGDVSAVARLVCDRVLAGYLAHADAPDRVTAVGDKTPDSVAQIAQLDHLYPEAVFIHVIRDGRDGAVSGWSHLQRHGHSGRFHSFTDYAEFYATYWTGCITAARAGARRCPGRYIEVRYEDLHRDPAPQVRRMLRLLRVDDGDAAVAGCLEAGDFRRLSGGRARGDEDPGSHYRKGVVGDWRGHFGADETARFELRAGDLLRELCYVEAGAGMANASVTGRSDDAGAVCSG